MIKTIVFDLGGVYFTLGTRIALPELYKRIEAPQEKIREVFTGHNKKEGWLFRKGKITKEEFWERAKRKLNIDGEKAYKVRELLYSSYKPQKGMKELVETLKENYKVMVFSGNIEDRVEYLDKRYGLYDLFDDLVFSFDFGLTKRDIEFYKILLKKIDCHPQECVCVDDSERVLALEKSLGMKTILFKDAKQLKSDLRKFGVKI